MPGEWTLYITSESSHEIRACGISTKDFDFGFAIGKPKNMSQTSHRPLKGILFIQTYRMINCIQIMVIPKNTVKFMLMSIVHKSQLTIHIIRDLFV